MSLRLLFRYLADGPYLSANDLYSMDISAYE